MFLQSVPSPSGFTRRRPRLAIALISCLLVAGGLSDEVRSTTTTPNLERIGTTGVEVSGKVARSEWKSELDEGAGKNGHLPELFARQVTSPISSSSSSSSASPTTTRTTASPSRLVPQSTTIPPETETISPSSTETTNPSSTSSSPVSTSTAVPADYEIPRPFDSTLGTNFSSTACPSFFATFLADPEFISCAPFSLLLGTSSSFFQAQRSPYSILPYVLNSTCSAPSDSCAALMDKYARQIKLDNTCGPDLSSGNPLAQEALEGFQNYRLYREVGCQKNNETEARYCFADASADSNPDSLYFYYLAEGTTLPSGTVATCDFCLQTLMATYSRYAVNGTLPISKTYSGGRSVAALACGPNFAPLISKTTSNAAASTIPASALSWLVFLFAASLFTLY
ncbi:uncharacterized protein JCM6883_006406 [Sporobolomyces salmoneus]|uniref:uncharacterized protein n=1 Tax=Sporobolomyces salmoneus TaxID=183962 RepID=UPI0031782175